MVNSVQPSVVTNNNIISADTHLGQKLERNQEKTRPVVDRKQETPTAREEIPREEVEKAADKLNRLMRIIDKRLEFSVHDKSKRVMVKVIDKESGEVINEIPPKKVLDMLSNFSEMVGLLVDKRI